MLTDMGSYFSNKRYAVLIDCGSSGSRLYIYYWSVSNQYTILPDIKRVKDAFDSVVSFKINPGLSTFAETSNEAPSYISGLIKKSYDYIPSNSHKHTLLYVLATGGMRLLPSHQQTQLMNNLKTMLPRLVKFQLVQVEVIPGPMEGVFMWIALNYILKNFQKNCGLTSGSVEVGGASTQIAFEVANLAQKTAAFTYMCQNNNKWITHNIFSVTFLGLGVNSAFKHYNKNSIYQPLDKEDHCLPLECSLSEGFARVRGGGNADICHNSLIDIFDRYLRQKNETLVFTSFKRNLNNIIKSHNMTFYGLSELWYSFFDYLHYHGPLVPSLYWPLNKEFCSTKCHILEHNLMHGFYNNGNPTHLKTQCFKASFLRYLTNKLFPNNNDNPIININTHNGEEIEWTYGAIIFYSTQKPR